MALIVELLGPVPVDLARRATGPALDIIDPYDGSLRNISELKFWGLEEVLIHRYHLPEAEASYLADFLLPMLELDPRRRATALTALEHPWLKLTGPVSERIKEEDTFASDLAKIFSKRQHPDLHNTTINNTHVPVLKEERTSSSSFSITSSEEGESREFSELGDYLDKEEEIETAPLNISSDTEELAPQ